MNAKMPELKRAFEEAGFTDVKTLLSSGNVVFGARASANDALERKAEKAMCTCLGRTFLTIVRPIDALRKLLDSNPFASFDEPRGAKRTVTFLRAKPAKKLALPIELDGARILAVKGTEVFSDHVPSPQGAVFMVLIEKTFGKDVTTRTWETVQKVAR
jgi:uncharacterized protein (DUF1697 family)